MINRTKKKTKRIKDKKIIRKTIHRTKDTERQKERERERERERGNLINEANRRRKIMLFPALPLAINQDTN